MSVESGNCIGDYFDAYFTLLHMYFAYIFCKIHIYNTFFMNYVNSDFSRHTRCTPAIPLNSQSTMPISL